MSYEMLPIRWPVKAWPKIRELIGSHDAHVAGGYASWHMSDRFDWRYTGQPYDFQTVAYDQYYKTLLPSNHPQDLDIFTYSEDTYAALSNRLSSAGFENLKTTKYCSTWVDACKYLGDDSYSHLRCGLGRKLVPSSTWRVRSHLPVQLIRPVFGKNLVEVLDHFDFYLVKFALMDDDTVLAHKDALKTLDERTLKHAHPEQLLDNPFHVLWRYMKYVQKGYKVNYMEMLRAVTTAQTQDAGQLKQETLRELVQRFGQYLRSGDSLGRGEDFRPTFEGAYEEWMRCLLAKKAKL